MYQANVLTEGLLPSIAIRGIAPFPHTDLRIEVGRIVSRNALLEAEKNYGNHVLLLIQENPMHDKPTPENVLRHGVVAKIGMRIKLPNGNFKVKNANIKPLFEEVSRITAQFKEFYISHIPREQNKMADEMANIAMDRRS